MRNGSSDERYFNQTLAGIDNTFLNGAYDFGCFADADSDLAFAISYGYDGTEAQFLSAFDHFGHASNLDDFFFPVRFYPLPAFPFRATVRVAGIVATALARALAAAWIFFDRWNHCALSLFC
jgi:hypothetical protein